MTVGERICKRRIELKMTMEELAKRIGKQAPAVNKYEKDLVDMPLSVIKALHRELGISYIELLDDDDSEDRELVTAYHRVGKETQKAVRAVLSIPEKEKNITVSVG